MREHVFQAAYHTAHVDIELIWFATFKELVADLIERFSHAAEASQAEGDLMKAEPNVLAEDLINKIELVRW